MAMDSIRIKAFSYYVPEGRITNDQVVEPFLEVNKDHLSSEDIEYISYSCKRKFEFLGVQTRSIGINGDNAVGMAVKVCEDAMAKANVTPQEIDCLIFAAVSNPFFEPSFATVIAKEIGIETGDFFDIGDTCNGFMKGIEIAGIYLSTGKYRNVLVVASEHPYEVGESIQNTARIDVVEDIDKKFSTFFAGSGAGAFLLSKEGDGPEIKHYFQYRETENWDISLYMLPGITLPKTRYEKILNGIWADPYSLSALIIQNMPGFLLKSFEENDIDKDKIDLFFTHQLGDNITFATLDKLGVERSKAPIHTFKEFGNLAAANLPVSIGMANDAGLLEKGKNVVLMSSACGLTFACMYITW
ncbi:3-oxoacyl-[acyl-carrier-protein] synthase-3 [Anaerobacterium chartisolvens]|uniref:3-oxoacyl-[acyl-carrier-protein] synthase-3 n=2 Tax=Anaerobacterium chartisolvens TaxID=1297424 RepID=A0A369B437_9FIRM|nr:3-oxoacyl-[acyl-carrier-protein] synthase-3 [Anaerobacterium chartisolvens]